jgi:hypothetical protein
MCIAHDPGTRLRDIAARPGSTERSAHGIITDLTAAGYLVKQKDGRRNRYQIQAYLPLPEAGGCAPPTRRRCARSAAGRDGTRGCCAGCCRTARCWSQATSRRPCRHSSGPPVAATRVGGPAAGGRRTAAVADRQPGPGHRVHHVGLARFPAAAARVLRPGGQLFIYTRTPQQNARTIWARCFPGFTKHEQRLHSQAALRDAVRRTDGLKMVATQTFQYPRTSTAERLGAQAQGAPLLDILLC